MKKEFLYKVLNQIIREIRIDYDDQETYTPFIKNEISFISYYNPNDHFKSIFSEHCRNVYGLGRGEIMMLWRLFLNKMKNKIGRMDGLGNINESTDIDKKFLDRVLDQIVSEITIDYEKEKIYVPFLSSPFRLHPSTMTGLRQGYTSPFSEHCRDVYGLNEEEIDYVWDQLRNNINNSIR